MKNAFNQLGLGNYNNSRGAFKGLRRNSHRACYTRKRKSMKLRNYDRWCRNNQPWLGGDHV